MKYISGDARTGAWHIYTSRCVTTDASGHKYATATGRSLCGSNDGARADEHLASLPVAVAKTLGRFVAEARSESNKYPCEDCARAIESGLVADGEYLDALAADNLSALCTKWTRVPDLDGEVPV